MKKIYFLTPVFAFLLLADLVAQQAPQYSMYFFNQYAFNPAYAGLDNSLSITGVYRKQWAGLEGSPSNQNLNAHLPWYYLGGAIGIQLDNDILGAERNTQISMAYAYHLKLSRTSILSIGLDGGVVQKTLDGNQLRAPEGTFDPEGNLISHNDNFIPQGIESAIAPTARAGVYFQSKNIEIGISANQLPELTADFNTIGVTKFQFLRNYFAIFAYNLEVSDNLALKPSVYFKSDLTEHQLDFSIIGRYNGNIFGGVSFRGYSQNTLDSVVFTAGLKVSEKVTVAYAYDLTLSNLSSVSNGSHELMFNYNLNKKLGGAVPSKIIYNPRFL